MTAATSGNGNLVFGDNTGNLHLVNRTYEVTTFRAYDLTLTLAQQVQHSTFLFTIGVSIVAVFYYALIERLFVKVKNILFRKMNKVVILP